MLQYLTFAVLVAASMGATTMMATMMPDPTPPSKMCCMPKVWQATMLDLHSPTGLKYATIFVYDAMQQKEGYIVVPVDGSAPVAQGFTDYKMNVKYDVILAGQVKCTVTKPDHMFYETCPTDITTSTPMTNVTYVGSSTLGPMGKGIIFDAWMFVLDGMTINMALARDGCIPIIEAVKSDDPKMPVDSLYMFNDVTTTITEPYLLQKPVACQVGSGSVVG